LLDSKTESGVPTIEEKIKAKSQHIRKWEGANPGLSWDSVEHPEDEPKIYITKEMLNSQAYRSLSRAAMLIYQDFLARRDMRPIKRNKQKTWVIGNNGKIVYPYAEAVRNGFTRATYRNAIDELQIKGFIDITHMGKGGRKPADGTGDFTTYWIDDRWQDYNPNENKSNRPPRKPRSKETRTNKGFKLIWNDKKKAVAMLAKRTKK
jgi:hypothetical protein